MRCPDETLCDYFLWGICDPEIRRVKPRDLGELLEVVSDFIESLARTWSGGLSGMSGPVPRFASKWAAVTVE